MISNTAVAILLVGAVCCAPPIEPDVDPTEATILVDITTIMPGTEESAENEVKVCQTEKAITVGYSTSPPPQQARPKLSGTERKALISHLSEYDLRTVDPLVLTPRQQFAILQELEHQELGLHPFTDPTPWQRLAREQQMEFNRKYLALRVDLQEYSRNQFLSLPEDGQAHAYQAFLSVDFQTLAQAIEREFVRERKVLEQQRVFQEQKIAEQKSSVKQQTLSEQYKHQKMAEWQRLAEQQKIAEQQIIAEQLRIAEQQTFAEQQRIAEQQSIAEQQKIAEQQRVAEQNEQEQKLAEQKILVAQQNMQENDLKGKQLVEEHILAEQVRLYEQQNLAYRQSSIEKQKYSEQQRELDNQRQQGINKLFEVALSQQGAMVTTIKEPRSQSRKMIKSLQELTEISDITFQHSKPVQLTSQLIKAKIPTRQQNRQVKPKLTKYSQQHIPPSLREHIPPSLRELQRQQKRLNIRRLNFDPRRKQ